MLIHVLRVRFSDVSGISTTRHLVGVISAMVEKELGQRNFGFDSLKSRQLRHGGEMNCCPGLSPAGAPQRVIYIGSGPGDMEEVAEA